VSLAVALRPASFRPSKPLPAPKVLIVHNVTDADLVLKRSTVLDTIGSKAMALTAAALAEGFGDVSKLPDHEAPLSVLDQAILWLQPGRSTPRSLVCSRSGTIAAIDPKTHEVLFRTDRLDSGHPFIDAAYITRHALDAEASGAYRDLRQLADAAKDALLVAAAEEASSLKAHARDVEQRLDEAYASGDCPKVVVFLGAAHDAEAKGRGFKDRKGLEIGFASIGVPCLSLNKDGGFDLHASASDIDKCLRQILSPHLRTRRYSTMLIYPKLHVYPDRPKDMPNHIGSFLANKCSVFSETVADAAFADSTVLDDLDSPELASHKAFVKVDEAYLEKWKKDHPGGGLRPTVMLNVDAGFKTSKAVSDEAARKRKAELANVVAPKNNIGCKNRDAQKKVPFDYERWLKPGGVWDLARLKELKGDFETQIGRYQDAISANAKIPRDFWNWKGQSEPSQSSLAKTLGITKIKGPVPGPMGGYARVLGEKITALESSMTD
jgi:hypothetical protein